MRTIASPFLNISVNVKIKIGLLIGWIFFLVFFLSACGDKTSPEDQVRQFISAGVSAAESRDVLAMRELISKDYKDSSGRDRRYLAGLMTGYVLRHKNIHLFTQVSEIHFPVAEQAEVTLYIAMAGAPVSSVKALMDLRADLYRFELYLVRENEEWRVQKANWDRAGIDNLLEK